MFPCSSSLDDIAPSVELWRKIPTKKTCLDRHKDKTTDKLVFPGPEFAQWYLGLQGFLPKERKKERRSSGQWWSQDFSENE